MSPQHTRCDWCGSGPEWRSSPLPRVPARRGPPVLRTLLSLHGRGALFFSRRIPTVADSLPDAVSRRGQDSSTSPVAPAVAISISQTLLACPRGTATGWMWS